MKGLSPPALPHLMIYHPPPQPQCHLPLFPNSVLVSLLGLSVKETARSRGDPTADRRSLCCPGGSITFHSSQLRRWRWWVRSLSSPGSRSRSGGRTGDTPSEAGQSRLTPTSVIFSIFPFTLAMEQYQSQAVDIGSQCSKIFSISTLPKSDTSSPCLCTSIKHLMTRTIPLNKQYPLQHNTYTHTFYLSLDDRHMFGLCEMIIAFKKYGSKVNTKDPYVYR